METALNWLHLRTKWGLRTPTRKRKKIKRWRGRNKKSMDEGSDFLIDRGCCRSISGRGSLKIKLCSESIGVSCVRNETWIWIALQKITELNELYRGKSSVFTGRFCANLKIRSKVKHNNHLSGPRIYLVSFWPLRKHGWLGLGFILETCAFGKELTNNSLSPSP